MSDFGTLITIKRRDGNRANGTDKERLREIIDQVVSRNQFIDANGDKLTPKVIESYDIDGAKCLMAIITEYWLDSHERRSPDSYRVEQILKLDEPACSQVHDALQNQLSGHYYFEWYAGEW